MFYPFQNDPAAAQLDPEKKRKFFQRRMIDSADPVMGTTEYLLNMAAQMPATPRQRTTVSGSSVIGMTPEQTTALLDRVQQQSQFEQRVDQEEKARRDRQIEGFGERIFRARDMEQQRQMRAQERAEERAFQQTQETDRRLYEHNRWAEQQSMGQIQSKPDGSQVRIWRDPETGEMMQEDFAPRQPKGGFQTVLGEDGNPVRKWMQEGEQAPAYVRGATGAGGTLSPTQAAYAISELRRQGLTMEQIAQRAPQLAPFVQGVDGSAADPALDKEKRAFIARYIQNQTDMEPQEAIQQAEQIWGAMNGTPIPPRPIAQVAAQLGAGDKGIKGRENLGMALLQEGYPLPEIVQYLNTAGVADNLKWFRGDSPADEGQWGNDQLAGQPAPTQPVAPAQPQVNAVPWTVTGTQSAAPAQPLDQNAAAMMGTMGAPGAGKRGVYTDPATGAQVKGTLLPDGTFVPEQ